MDYKSLANEWIALQGQLLQDVYKRQDHPCGFCFAVGIIMNVLIQVDQRIFLSLIHIYGRNRRKGTSGRAALRNGAALCLCPLCAIRILPNVC